MIRLVTAVVREKGNLGMFQFHHNPHPKTDLHPSQTSCLSLVRNQVGSLVRNHVKSLAPKPKPRPICFHCEFCGKDGHKREFCFKRRREARMAEEWANKDKYCPSHGVLEPRMSLPKGKGFGYTVPTWRDRRASGGGKSAGRGPPARPVRVTGQTGARQSAEEYDFHGRDARGFSPFSRGTYGKHLEFGGHEFAGRSPPRDQYEFGRGRSFES
jgi:hypothetical protein